MVLKFLTHQFESGSSYSTINTHRAALSQILGPNLSEDFRIKRFFQGPRHLRPSHPKYRSTWDPSVVLNYIKKLSSSSFSLQHLTYKTAMILALATGQRVQTLASIDLGNLHIFPERLDIHITKPLKTTHTSQNHTTLVVPSFTEDADICAAKAVLSYLEETKTIRGNIKNLFITFKKLYHPASTQTISRWLKTTLKLSGVDVSLFGAHSTRHASTSSAARKAVHYDNIRLADGWTEKSKMFAIFHNKPLTQNRLDTQRTKFHNLIIVHITIPHIFTFLTYLLLNILQSMYYFIRNKESSDF
ncbi:unnamed protein product, partial [Callosobruchus maculatus]